MHIYSDKNQAGFQTGYLYVIFLQNYLILYGIHIWHPVSK